MPCITSFAQVGPGGVGSSGTLGFWVDASKEAYANGASVSTLTDWSENGNTFNASSAPTFQTNVVNGRPIVRFSGSQYMSVSSTSNMNGPTSLSWFGVATHTGGDSWQTVFDTDYSENGYKISINIANDRIRSSLRSNGGSYTIQQSSAAVAFRQLASTWNSASTSFTTWVNGSQVGTTSSTGTVTMTTAGKTGLGGNTINSGGRLNGDIAEVFVYNSAVNTTQRIIIQNYLASKYGLSAGSDKYAHDGGNGNEVAGIGRESGTDAHLEAQGSSIVRVRNATSLDNGDYLMWGHDNGALTTNSTNVPASYSGSGGLRLNRVWRADENNTDVGNVTVVFVMTDIQFGTDPEQYELLTDADGDFSNATSTGTNPTISGDSVIFNSVNLPDDHFFTIGNTNVVSECISLNSDSWQNVVWDCGTVPDSTNNATILGGTSVTVSDTRTINDITIEGTLVLNATGTLVVKGDFTVSAGGSVTTANGSEVIFRGTTAQSLTNNDGTPAQFADLTINNSSGVSIAGGEFHLKGGLSLRDGQFANSAGTFRFRSFSGRHASIVDVGSGGSISGTFRVDRFIATRDASWGTISSPVTNTNWQDLDNEIYISGVEGGEDGSAAGFQSVWLYNEADNAYEAVANITDPVTTQRGYEIWLAHDMNNWNDSSMNFNGTIDMSEVNISLNTTGGWNLIGNPYPAFLGWTSVSNGVGGITGDEFWIFDAATSQYISRGDGNTIPPAQGFWVHSSTSTLTLTPTEDLVNTSSSAFFKSGYVPDHRQVSLHLESTEDRYAHTAYVRSEPSAYAGFDEYDMTMLRSPDTNACEVALEAGDQHLLVNYVSTFEERVVLPFKLTAGTAGKYTLKVNGLDHFNEYQCANLIDRQTNREIPLTSAFSYYVTLEEDEAQYFDLVLSREGYDDCTLPSASTVNSEAVNVYAQNSEVNITYRLEETANAEVEVFDLMGNKVHSEMQTASFNRQKILLEKAASGIYMVNIRLNNGTTFSKKVFIQ